MKRRNSPEAALRASANRFGAWGPNGHGEFFLVCPFCPSRVGKDDEKRKLHANPGKGVWICFRCGMRGRAKLDWLPQAASLPGDAEDDPSLRPIEFQPLDLSESVTSQRPFRDYLARRGVLDQAASCRVMTCSEGRYRDRVIVPVIVSGFWRGFSARAIYPNRVPKYLYPPGMERRNLLWVPPGGLSRSDPDLFLVEGVFDALPLYPAAIATFGKDVSEGQIDLLVTYWDMLPAQRVQRLVVALDGDAWRDAQVLSARLALRGIPSAYCRLPPKTDPGVLGNKIRDYIVPA